MNKYVSICLLYLSAFSCSFSFAETHLESSNPEIKAEQSEKFYDLFPGTIKLKNDRLYLHVCRLVDEEFPLTFNHPQDRQTILDLLKEHKKFWVNLSTEVEQKDEKYHMNVEGIYEKHLNETCHLSELLDDYEKNQSK